MRWIEGAAADDRRHPTPTVIDAADPGAAREHGTKPRRIAALHIGAQAVEGCGEVGLETLQPGGAWKVQKIPSAHRLAEGDEGFRPALQPEAVLDGKRKDDAVGRAFDD